MTVDLLHELLRSHGEHPLGQVRTAGVRGFIGSDGSVVDAPLWLAISTHRAWLAAVHEGEVRAVAEADREQVRVHRGWLVDEVQVGPWRAPLRASTRASAEGLVARWKAGAPHGTSNGLIEGLKLLEQLDTRAALQAYRGPQLHLFGGLDALVPAEASADLLNLLPDIEVGMIEQASHAFILENPHGVAAAIQAFLHESGDD